MKAKHDITVPVRSVGTDTFWVLHTHCEKASLLFTGIPACKRPLLLILLLLLLLLSSLLLLCAIVVIVMLVAVAAIVVVMIRAVVIIAKIIGGLP